MARVILNERAGPFPVSLADLPEGKAWICGCGLTRTPPYCDKSHAAARGEAPGSLVYYPDNDADNAPVSVDPAPFATARRQEGRR